MTTRNRRLLAGVIVGFWAVMVALFIREYYVAAPVSPVAQETALTPTDTWMGVYLPGDVRAGYLNVRTAPSARDGLEGMRANLNMQMDVAMLGAELEIDLIGSAWVSLAHGLETLRFRLQSGDTEMEVNGNVVEEETGRVLRLVVATAGEEFPVTVPVEDGLSLWGAGGASMLNLPALEPGDQYRLAVFDPMTLSVQDARLRYIAEEEIKSRGETVKARKVEVDVNGMRSLAWVGDAGDVLRMETPLGLTLARISPEDAFSSETGDADLLSLAAIQPAGARPFRGARRMRFRLAGQEAHTIPEDASQRQVDGAIWEVEPVAPGHALAGQDAPAEADLAADPFVQADHPRIVETATQIVGDADAPWDRARAVNAWVHETLAKEPVASIPSALEVLRTRAGDCNEHTVLFTALARAAGIPTRIALGIVWSEEYEAFYYHAWPEVFVENWVWMDPTFGQEIADATHIKLLTGSVDQWPRLMPFLGMLAVDVLEVEGE
jgi:transglutaminase-like putative cysteine protease